MEQVQYLRTRDLRQRYKRTDRTILDWIKKGVLPKPRMIAKRRAWTLAEIEQNEREKFAS